MLIPNLKRLRHLNTVIDFHQLGPLGRVGLVVDMSVCVFVCPLPMRFFSRPLIGPQIT